MGFFVVLLNLAMVWILLVMPVCGLIFLALSLFFRRLHKKHMGQSSWRRIVSIICAVLAGLNLLAGAVGWIFMAIAGH